MAWEARIHRIAARSPDDISGLEAAVAQGRLDPAGIIAILGKTEGNGCVNDFTRGFATVALKAVVGRLSGQSEEAVAKNTLFVMSGGTEGGLSPHWLVFETIPQTSAPQPGVKALAIGSAVTRPFQPEEIGRTAQIQETAAAVRRAMAAAQITDPADVHYVQVKCPLLTKARIAAASSDTVTTDTLKSMGYSRGASSLGVALALGEVDDSALSDAVVCQDLTLFSGRASASAGIELLENQILVIGASTEWSGPLRISHAVMQDAIDMDAVQTALGGVGMTSPLPLTPHDRAKICAVLAKAEAATSGEIRGQRHTMLDDSDIASSRHARALVGGVIAGALGFTTLFVSGGAEHQGPDGGGPIAIIASV